MHRSRRFVFGDFISDETPLSLAEIERICEKAQQVRRELQNYPFDKVRRILGRLAQKWRDPEYHLRKIAEQELPTESGYAPAMIRAGLDVMAGLLDPEFLQKKIDTELRNIPVIEGYDFDFETGTARQWQPLGVVLHVLAGNVFTGGVGSWIEGALTRNVTILKMSSAERVFMPLFIESLVECDPDKVLTRATALIDYSSSQTEVIDHLKQIVDGVVVWGGEQAVRAYRENLPARTRLVLFGPKLSMSIITAGGADENTLANLAERLAGEMAVWDQNACTAPQICYVEGRHRAYELAALLARELEHCEQQIPSGDIDLNSAVEIRKLRSLYEVNQLLGKSGYWSSGEDLRWSVFVDENIDLQPSPLHRTIRIIPFERISQIVEQVQSYRGYVQTLSLECASVERLHLTSELAQYGIIRFVGLGQMAGGEIDDPHDGAYDLPQLLNLVILRSQDLKERHIHPIDRMTEARRRQLLDANFRDLIDHARTASYYREVIEVAEKKLGRALDSLDDLSALPILSRELMERHMAPFGQGLETGAGLYNGGYVSRSGGSTGTPKFSVYDEHDWEEMIARAVRVLHAAGLRRGDRLANCMIAGDLYGSFVSFDHINVRLGLTTYAFSTKVTAEMFADVWRKFGLNAIQGVPAFVVPLLREAKKIEPNLMIEKFIFAGQAMSQRDSQWLREELGLRIISSIIGANDGGQIAYQCEHLSGPMHHVSDDFNYIEIVDGEGQRCVPGEKGQLLITSLHKYRYPLIRYAIGDAARFVEKSCSCGRTNRIIEYLGRYDNIFSVGFMNIDFADVEKALAKFSPSLVQVVARQDEAGVEYIIVRLELLDVNGVSDEQIISELKNHITPLSDRLKEGRLSKVVIEKYKDGALQRDPRSAKVKSFLDER